MGMRASLCASTALQAAALVVLATPAAAQLAANTRPTGGQVAAGSATIGGNASTTLINQSSQNAVINWQAYNVGSAQTVQYNQPGASSFTLNRVLSNNPSQIAGHIIANGQIAIVNQSGVVFLQGATVDTAGLVVSAAGITNQDFMAGRIVLSQAPHAGAVVSNAGNITIRQAGLAALVAPQVANSGTITASLGRVVLGGVSTATLDMYGDGLVALNVTGQVTQVQIGNQKVPALVTNIGTILAPGGTVVLTAQAADGLVNTLVSVGGHISAPTTGGQAGRVLVSGIGGDVEVEGAVSATGTVTGSQGGTITVDSDHNVIVASSGAIDASGSAGGGSISLGAHAINATLAAGAVVRADATQNGAGGNITIRSGGATTIHGSISAAGGPQGGSGGRLQLIGQSLLVDGSITTASPMGQPGTLTYSATGSLTVQANCGEQNNCLSFANFLDNGSAIDDSDGAITFVPGQSPKTQTLTSQAAIVLDTTLGEGATESGDIIFEAGFSAFAPSFTMSSAGGIYLGGVIANGVDIPATTVQLSAAGPISEHPPGGGNATGSIDASMLLISNASDVTLDDPGNNVAALAGVTTTGNFTFTDATGLSVTAPIAAGGAISIDVTGAGNSLDAASSISGNGISLTAADNISLEATVDAGTSGLAMQATGGSITASGAITADVLAAQAAGSILLTSASNAIGTIGTVGALSGVQAGRAGAVDITDGSGLLVAANVVGNSVTLLSGSALTLDSGVTIEATAGDLSLAAQFGGVTLAGTLLATGAATAEISAAGNIVQTGGVIDVGTLTATAENSDGGVSGNITLGQDNSIGALGNMTATGSLLVLDSGALQIVAGDTVYGALGVTLDVSGTTLTQGVKSIIVSTEGDVSIAGALDQIGGTLAAFGTVSISGNVAQSQLSGISGDSVLIGTGGGAATLTQDDSFLGDTGGVVTIMLTGNLVQSATGVIASEEGMQISTSGGSLFLGGIIYTGSSYSLVLNAAGGITEVAQGADSATGTILTGMLTGSSGTSTDLENASSADTGNQIYVLGPFTSGGSFTLVDGAGLTVAGALAAADITLRTPSLTVAQDAAMNAAAGGTISIGADAYSILGTMGAQDGLVALGLLHAGNFTVAEEGTIDPASLLNIYTGGGTIALGTTDGISANGNNGQTEGGTWTVTTSGSVSNLTIIGALNLDGGEIGENAGTLGLFSNDGIDVNTTTQDGVTVGVLYGAAGGDFLAPSIANAIADIGTAGVVVSGGSLVLADGIGLALDAGAQVSGTNGVTLTVTGNSILQNSGSAIDSSGGAVALDATLLTQASQASIRAQTGFSDTGDVTQVGQNLIVTATGDYTSGTVNQAAGSDIVAEAGNVTVQGDATQSASEILASLGSVSIAGTLTQVGGTLIAGANVGIGTGDQGSGTAATVLLQSAGSTMSAGGNAIVYGGATQSASGMSATGQATIYASLAQTDGSTLDGGAVTIGVSGDAATLSQQGASSITAGAGALAVTLSGDLTQDATSVLASSAGNVALTSGAGGLFLSGLVSGANGIVSLIAEQGTVTQAAQAGGSATGTVLAGTLVAQAGGTAGFDLLLDSQGVNRIGAIETATATGTVNLNDAEDATELAQGTIGGDAGVTLTLAGQTLTQGAGSVIASADGAVFIDAASLVQQNQATIAANTGFSLTGDLDQQGQGAITASAGTLAIGGNATQSAGSTLYAAAGDLVIGGNLNQAASSAAALLDINVGGATTQAASTLAAGQNVLLGTASAGGNAIVLSQTDGSNVSAGQDTTIFGGVTQDASTIAVAGAAMIYGGLVQGGGSLLNSAGDVNIGGTLEQTGGAVVAGGNLTLAGDVTQSNSSLAAGGNLTIAGALTQDASTATASGSLTMSGGGALVQTGGSGVSGQTGVDLILAGGLSQDGASFIGSAGGNVAIDATSGNIDFAGIIEAAPASGVLNTGLPGAFLGNISLIAAAGNIEGGSGTVWTSALAGRAAGDIDLAGTRNQIATIQAIGLPGGGAVSGLAAGGTLNLNDTSALAVQDSVISGTRGVLLTLAGGLTESAGSTIASSGGALAIESPATLQFAGELAAPLILLGDKTAPREIVWNGGTIETGSAISIPPNGGSPNIPNPIGPGNPYYASGLFATAGNFIQTGTTIVGGVPGAARQTVQLTLTGPGGTIAFDPGSNAGLFGPTTQLLLDLNSSGRATGNINVAGLNVYYFGSAPGAGGGSILTGSVDGFTGVEAAAAGFVHSLPNVDYQLNGCPIESLSCVLTLPPLPEILALTGTVPWGGAMPELDVAVVTQRQDDDDLILLNVAEQDY
jgi:filamentous hemagglutinin family protein